MGCRAVPRWIHAISLACAIAVLAGCSSRNHNAGSVPVRIPLYAGLQGYRAISPASAAQIARSVRLLVATPRQLRAIGAAIERSHPGITTEVYVNAMFVHPD